MREVLAGIDAGGTRIKIGLADRSGQLISNSVLDSRTYRDSVSFVDSVGRQIADMARFASVRIAAAGIGCPGRIDYAAGKVLWLKNKLQFLEGAPLADLVADRLGCPVVCDNDVNAILAGEMRFGAGRGYRNVVGVAVGTGIGGGLILDGKLVRGHHWATGHFGFMSHDPCGPRHVCGNTGIAEEYASQSGILGKIRQALDRGESSSLIQALQRGEEPGFRELFEALATGDSLARELANRLTIELGTLIANLVYAFDPEVVLLGGGILNCLPGILDGVRREAAHRLQYLPANAPRVLSMALGDAAGILGGVALAEDAFPHLEQGQRAQGD